MLLRKHIRKLQKGISAIARNGFSTGGLQALWHPGNYNGNGNYLNNNPFPSSISDITGNNNILSFVNFSGTTVSGANGQNTSGNPCYIKTDGTNDYMQLAAGVPTYNEISVRFYCQFTSANFKRLFFWKPDGSTTTHLLVAFGDGFITAQANNGTTTVSKNYSATADTNYEVCATYDRTTVNLYVNGVIATNTTNQGYGVAAGLAAQLQFAAANSGSVSNARFYNMAIYNKILSQQEVTQNYNAGLIWR